MATPSEVSKRALRGKCDIVATPSEYLVRGCCVEGVAWQIYRYSKTKRSLKHICKIRILESRWEKKLRKILVVKNVV